MNSAYLRKQLVAFEVDQNLEPSLAYLLRDLKEKRISQKKTKKQKERRRKKYEENIRKNEKRKKGPKKRRKELM